jgi:hypothetical protein
MPTPQVLTLYLVGRICLVTKGKTIWALFLDAHHNPRLKLREHKPLFNAELSRVDQAVADQALLTIARPDDAHAVGVWPLSKVDITISGVGSGGTPNRDIKDLADLNAIVASVDPSATFQSGIVQDKNPSKFAVLARLRLPDAANISTESGTGVPEARVFLPGKYTQSINDYVSCEMTYAKVGVPPSLKLRRFGGSQSTSYKFRDDTAGGGLTLVMSNLCSCADNRFGKNPDSIDPEFRIYYQLLKTALPAKNEPVPRVDRTPITTGGSGIPECYNACRLQLPPY